MRIYDIDQPIVLERVSKMEDGAESNVSRLAMSVHAGTHVDAPYHFLAEGSHVAEMALKALTGRVYVLHLPDVDLVTADVLKNADIPPRTRRLIFKTRNSDYWAAEEKVFQKDFVALSADGAQYLVDRGVRLVGIDYLSVAPYDEPVLTHQILLQGGVIVVEGLDLSQVSQGRYTLYCLPLKLVGADGAPARAILIGV